MKNTLSFKSLAIIFSIIGLLWLFVGPDILEARRGSFGGSRGFSRSFSKPRGSFGGSRLSTRSSQSGRSSFGGKTLNTSRNYVSRYGAPRKTITGGGTTGLPSNYRVMDYGGYGSGLMMGYMMGHTSWMWMMPFHPAFYYSRPYYVNNPDGTVSVYPPTFSTGKLIFTLIIIGGLIFIIYRFIRSRRNPVSQYTDSARSSFD